MVRYARYDRSPSATVSRWLTRALVVGPALAAIAGLTEGIALYPATSWFGVTLYAAVLAVVPSLLLGGLIAGIVLVARRWR